MKYFTHRYWSCFSILLLAGLLPRLAHAEDLKAVNILFQLALLGIVLLAMALLLLALPFVLAAKWKRLSTEARWLGVVSWLGVLMLTGNILRAGLGSL